MNFATRLARNSGRATPSLRCAPNVHYINQLRQESTHLPREAVQTNGATSGAPTELYKQFRNPDHSKTAMGKAIRQGYAALYERNENVHTLDKKGLEGLVVQATGLDQGSATLRAITGTFENLKRFASFDNVEGKAALTPPPEKQDGQPETGKLDRTSEHEEFRLGLSYTINLVLPKTDDVAVFNAIFKALRENLLRK